MDIELNGTTYRKVTGIELVTNLIKDTSYLSIKSGDDAQLIRGEYQDMAALLEQCRAAGFVRAPYPID